MRRQPRTNLPSHNIIKQTKNAEQDRIREEKVQKAIELRRQGHTFQEIAEKVGYADKSVAYQVINSFFRRTETNQADIVRGIESERLNHIIKKITPDLESENEETKYRAAETLLKTHDRIAKLYNLNSTPVNITVNPDARTIADIIKDAQLSILAHKKPDTIDAEVIE